MAEQIPPDLIKAFRRLGLANAESWASSQVHEGINQLSRARLLYWLYQGVEQTDRPRSIEGALADFESDEARAPGTGLVSSPQALIYQQMLSAGFSEKQISIIIREAQISAIMHCCCVLDGCGGAPPEIDSASFGVFELDAEGKPIKQVDSLHENVFDFDTEAQIRRKKPAARKPRNP